MIESSINVHNANGGRLLRALELSPADSSGGQHDLDDFWLRVSGALLSWGPDHPEWPRDHYMLEFGRSSDYFIMRFQELLEMCEVGRRRGHRFVVWF